MPDIVLLLSVYFRWLSIARSLLMMEGMVGGLLALSSMS